MNLKLEYELGPSVYLAHRKSAGTKGLQEFRLGFLSWCALLAGTSLLGLAASVIANSLLLSLIFALVLASIAFEAITHGRRYEAAVRKSVMALPVRTVSMHIDSRGLHEVVAEVESFAPWSAVRSYAKTSETLAFELASGSWSVVPVFALSAAGPAALNSLMAARRLA